jgi:hypothetical protein
VLSGEVPGPESSNERCDREGLYSVLDLSRSRFAAYNDPTTDPRMILDQAQKSLQVVTGDPSAGLCFDRDLHVPEDDVHLDTARQSPACKLAVEILVAHEGGQLVVDPVLGGLPIEFGSRHEVSSKRQQVRDAAVDEVELGGANHPALGSDPVEERGSRFRTSEG